MFGEDNAAIHPLPKGGGLLAGDDKKQLVIPGDPRPLEFDISKGEPALPLKDYGKFWHSGWDIPTIYCIDAEKQCWMDGAHGGGMIKVKTSELLGACEDLRQRVNLETFMLDLPPSHHPCPTCGQLAPTKPGTK